MKRAGPQWSGIFLGMLPSLACVTLFDGAVHLTDEIAQPERNIPLVMVISNTLSGVMAFFAAIVYMFVWSMSTTYQIH